ncbi:MAG: DPP IV N-terminal domain-containing protein [Gemmatimonadetes bacterium]|nr:DPP IV N-terminal domain-containing protein [Gemmatimonadota bacterium]
MNRIPRVVPFRRLALVGLIAALVVAPGTVSPTSLAAQVQSAAVRKLVGGPGSANYELAARFAPYKIRDLLKSTTVSPHWIQHGDKFWYQWETTQGTSWYVVDPARGTKREIFDNARIAAELTRITHDPWDAQHLPIKTIRFIDDHTIQFDVQTSQDEKIQEADTVVGEQQQGGRGRGQRRPRTRKQVMHFQYDVTTHTLTLLDHYTAPDNHPAWASVSPDTQWVVFSRHFNLWAMKYSEYEKILDARRGKSGAAADSAGWKVKVDEVQLTTDGEKDYSWGNQGRGENDEETQKEFDRRQRPGIAWSWDSRYFALTREDQRKVGDLWVIHSTGNKRPQLETYKYDMPGEKNVTQTTLYVFDMQTRQMKKVDDKPWKDETMGVYRDPHQRGGGGFGRGRGGGGGSTEPRISKWLSNKSDELYFYRASRDLHRIDVMVADPATDSVRTVIQERMNVTQEQQPPWRLANGDLVWWSERDGWAHLYRITPDGAVKAELTRGPWHVDGIEGIDEARGTLLFTANDREQGEDPYYRHTYRVGLDGMGLKLLDPGDFDHATSTSESAHYFVDNYSRVNTVPTSVLYDETGRKIMDLEKADFSLLLGAGYKFPQPFKVKAADGVTDLYGVMYKPYDFDSTKVYPIVEYVYPGPQTESVAKSFSTAAYEQALAQFGFIVVTVGNRGGHPDRSLWYHRYGYGNLRDYGLADKKVTVEELAERHPYIDQGRVGIYGHSGGGFMSTAAMLVYPDFFKVAVSSSGNHDNTIYNRWWGESQNGVKEEVSDSGQVSFAFSIATNPELAKNLKGHLLLTTGTADNNVHPSNTYRMALALIKANKRFDFFAFPDARHGYGNLSDYWFWLRAEYFVKNLLGDTRWSADITQLDVEHPETGGARRTGGGR